MLSLCIEYFTAQRNMSETSYALCSTVTTNALTLMTMPCKIKDTGQTCMAIAAAAAAAAAWSSCKSTHCCLFDPEPSHVPGNASVPQTLLAPQHVWSLTGLEQCLRPWVCSCASLWQGWLELAHAT